MKPLIKESATSLTALVFIVVGVSGILLYFHLFDVQVKALHETLGLLFVAAALLHVYFNWKGMKRYFPKKLFMGSAAVLTAISIAFIASAQSGPNPKVTLIERALNAPLAVSLPLLETDLEAAETLLGDRGIALGSADSLAAIARVNSVSPFELVMMITAVKQ
ncbi:DUF4405 domain-containing protein [Sulfurimonas sp. HSL-3221]|uniref:DUF4405 domain-containing protein n=1 Tax=Sulfurimonadaceae TaxID=2771471 RepID=UPI001E3FBB6B|nr:DUF4405 domain-containing protein [Sulfurimonas sp. HSL-3221]UFS62817.1 DUF4405 domain-containing protein [Sulfurimonas sp. HSL-3221]